MLFSLGFVALFLIGGLDGIHLAVVPVDWQLTDTYYVVGHIHYVLFGGAIFGLFSGIYYWFPKMTGRLVGRSARKMAFLADVHWHEHGLYAHAYARSGRNAAPHLYLRSRARLGNLELDRDDRGRDRRP